MTYNSLITFKLKMLIAMVKKKQVPNLKLLHQVLTSSLFFMD